MEVIKDRPELQNKTNSPKRKRNKDKSWDATPKNLKTGLKSKVLLCVHIHLMDSTMVM